MGKWIKILIIAWLCCISVRGETQSVSYIGHQNVQKKEVKKNKTDENAAMKCGTAMRPMVIASFPTNPPFGWTDVVESAQEPEPSFIGQGFGIELVQDIAKKIGLYVRPRGYQSYQDVFQDFVNGKIDVLVGGYYDTSLIRTGNVFVTPGFFRNIIVPVFMRGKEKKIDSFQDLVGLKGGVRIDENFYPLIYRSFPKDIDIQQFNTANEAFRALISGQVDYLLGSAYSIEAEARRFKVEEYLVYGEKPLSSLEFFLIFSGKSLCFPWKAKLADGIRAATQDRGDIRNRVIDKINQWGRRFAQEDGLENLITEEKKTDVNTQVEQ